MLQAFQYRRLIGLGGLVLIGFGGMEWRLYQLQVVRHEELDQKSRSYFVVKRNLPPLRGEIVDCRGRPLAMIRAVKNVFIDPCKLGGKTNEMARFLAPWLKADPEVLVRTKLKPRQLGSDPYGAPTFDNKVCLKLGVTIAEYEALTRALQESTFGYDVARLSTRQKAQLVRLRQRAIFAEDDQVRIYPHGELGCHLLGLVDHEAESGIFEAQSGIERVMDPKLAGTPGLCEGVRDVSGGEIGSGRAVYREPVDGCNVVLAMDAELQEVAAKELQSGMDRYGARGAVAIIVRVRTGEILALVSLPDYSLGSRLAVPSEAWRNRAIQDLIEPGSTFKIVTYTAALAEGLATWDTTVDCQNSQDIPHGRHLTDHERLEVVPLWMAFAKSSNKAAAQVGLCVGADRLHRYIWRFGFCEPTGLGFKEERFGRVPVPRLWSKTDLSRRAIGYGVAITPIQLAMAMSALANDGRLMRPLLITRVVNNQGKTVSNVPPQCVRQVVPPEIARQMVLGLKKVVSKQGTGRLAQLDGYDAAGKTGTAKVAEKVGDRVCYVPRKYRATFAGFLPADAPEVCIVVVYDQPTSPYYGGQTSAPVFARIAQKTADYLRLRRSNNAPALLAKGSDPTLPMD